MKLLPCSLFLAILCSTAQASQPTENTELTKVQKNPIPVKLVGEISCTDGNGQSIIFSETESSSYNNGQIIIKGNAIISYFTGLNFLQEKDAVCQTAKDGVQECSMAARVSIKDFSAKRNGRFDDNYEVRADFGGAKLYVYFGSNEPIYYNWWFSSCTTLPVE